MAGAVRGRSEDPVSEARSIGRATAGLTVVSIDVPQALGASERLRLIAQISDELVAASGQPIAGVTGQIQYAVNQTLHVTPDDRWTASSATHNSRVRLHTFLLPRIAFEHFLSGPLIFTCGARFPRESQG